MSEPRIALLNAAHDGTDNSRNFRRELDGEVVEFEVKTGDLPDDYDFDAGVVTGSRASVYWEETWIDDLSAWVGEAIERDVPFLGVCFGHQLLADVLGGTVESMGEYEIGYRTVEHHGSRLLAGVDPEFTVFTTHSDTVTELPPGAELLAENDYGVHGFRKDDVYGVQFHPEYDTATAEAVTRGKDLDPERKQRVLEGIDPRTYRRACEAKRLFENFLSAVERDAGTGLSAATERPGAQRAGTEQTATDD
jgi:GMP synthase (glutamine-hydrolysing)